MMQVTSPAAAVTAAPQANAGKNAEASRAAFASLLQHSRSVQTATPVAPEAPAPAADTAAANEADSTDAPAAPNTPSRLRLKVADKAAPTRPAEQGPKRVEGHESNQDGPADEQAETTRIKRSDTPAVDPSLAPWLAAPQPALTALDIAAARRRAAPDTGDVAADQPVDTDSAAGAKADDASALQHKSAADMKARAETTAASQEALAAWNQGARAESAAAQRVAQPVAEEVGRAKAGATDPIMNTAALAAAHFNPLLGAARESAAPLAVNLPTPLASQEFAQALGVQMSVLAADGVQRAELQLNPAEMGPVSVQIVIEGTNAHVDFGADLAATRQVIEAGMPELAGALRDAGFTLAGGGVSQHAGGRGDPSNTPGNTEGGSRRGQEAESQVAQPVLRRRSVAAGGVDLYA